MNIVEGQLFIAIVKPEICCELENAKAYLMAIEEEIKSVICYEQRRGTPKEIIYRLLDITCRNRYMKHFLDVARLQESIKYMYGLEDDKTYHVDTTNGVLTEVLLKKEQMLKRLLN